MKATIHYPLFVGSIVMLLGGGVVTIWSYWGVALIVIGFFLLQDSYHLFYTSPTRVAKTENANG
jgi:hypothetical protein